jgi:type IV pilus assembly protein PilC
MRKAYNYIAKTAGGLTDEGILVADNEEDVFVKLRDRGMRALSVEINPTDSLNLLSARNFDPSGLASYYMGLGLRLKNGMDPSVAVSDMKDQPRNFRLRIAAQELESLLRTGMKLGRAMSASGFPERDCAIIQAMEQGAKTAQGFENISKDYHRTADIQRKIKGMLLEPMFIGLVGIIGIWVTIVFGVPIYQHAFAQMATDAAAKEPSYVRLFYGFADLFNKAVVMDSLLYFLAVLGIIIFLRSKLFRRLLDQISTLRRFSEMVDNAALWGGFRLLIETSMDPEQIPFMLAKSAHRQDSREAFENLGNLMRRGLRFPQAIKQAGFPDYIAKDAASAMSAPGIDAQVQALDMMRNIMALRVAELTEKVVTLSRIMTVAGAGALVLVIAMLTFMPIMITEMSMV